MESTFPGIFRHEVASISSCSEGGKQEGKATFGASLDRLLPNYLLFIFALTMFALRPLRLNFPENLAAMVQKNVYAVP